VILCSPQAHAGICGLALARVEVVHGDTASVPFRMETCGSRSMAVGGGALALAAEKVIEKGKEIAAPILEAGEADLGFERGSFDVKGADRELGWMRMALAARVPADYPLDELEPRIEKNAFDDRGRLPTGSLLDDRSPRAADPPPIATAFAPVPTNPNPLGVKGAGESGATAAVVDALLDALTPLGIATIDMPATPERVLRAIAEARAATPA
jgi:carbon-monoxide dehydrogenase large subunit